MAQPLIILFDPTTCLGINPWNHPGRMCPPGIQICAALAPGRYYKGTPEQIARLIKATYLRLIDEGVADPHYHVQDCLSPGDWMVRGGLLRPSEGYALDRAYYSHLSPEKFERGWGKLQDYELSFRNWDYCF